MGERASKSSAKFSWQWVEHRANGVPAIYDAFLWQEHTSSLDVPAKRVPTNKNKPQLIRVGEKKPPQWQEEKVQNKWSGPMPY
jgi:hypothetical protein